MHPRPVLVLAGAALAALAGSCRFETADLTLRYLAVAGDAGPPCPGGRRFGDGIGPHCWAPAEGAFCGGGASSRERWACDPSGVGGCCASWGDCGPCGWVLLPDCTVAGTGEALGPSDCAAAVAAAPDVVRFCPTSGETCECPAYGGSCKLVIESHRCDIDPNRWHCPGIDF
ncbi:MAG: hypothetical protein FJ087_13865 [Deltaproteobacteria bacterium]|nr:hypothetical protein [Deltaproteobacteria bacterium]